MQAPPTGKRAAKIYLMPGFRWLTSKQAFFIAANRTSLEGLDCVPTSAAENTEARVDRGGGGAPRSVRSVLVICGDIPWRRRFREEPEGLLMEASGVGDQAVLGGPFWTCSTLTGTNGDAAAAKEIDAVADRLLKHGPRGETPRGETPRGETPRGETDRSSGATTISDLGEKVRDRADDMDRGDRGDSC
eukprot:gnl/TRDRNA2_/TRDRNA2_149327_c0_seq1.p2 gnl/TRDRNA2_/TRDRNA2_149327_c0~~gnl/TRDRNA2_/TRDRNA2_149327_c0_seq1.p2  ORF type:complete len:189 (+),score=27.88 gnl/TRDRNA2_/TRDRNA2_149327_c0_seq1:368-934(+)